MKKPKQFGDGLYIGNDHLLQPSSNIAERKRRLFSLMSAQSKWLGSRKFWAQLRNTNKIGITMP